MRTLTAYALSLMAAALPLDRGGGPAMVQIVDHHDDAPRPPKPLKGSKGGRLPDTVLQRHHNHSPSPALRKLLANKGRR